MRGLRTTVHLAEKVGRLLGRGEILQRKMQKEQNQGTDVKKIGLLFPHQLFREHPMLGNVDKIYLVEEFLFFKQYKFHKQKIEFHRASMKAMEADLKSSGVVCTYIEAGEERSDVRVLIQNLFSKMKGELHYIDPTDDWLRKRIEQQANSERIQAHGYESPLFLNTTDELESFFREDKKSYFQTTFYKQQRTKRNILLNEDGSPVGGQWSFDAENRKKYPKNQIPPEIIFPNSNTFWDEAVAYTRNHFGKNPGELDAAPLYPVTPGDAERWFGQFLQKRFSAFGDYEDALVADAWLLHHSLLTPLLNTGLLKSQDVIDQALDFADQSDVPLNSLEGFVRQIIGWREFIRGMYECKGREMRTRNFWGFDRKIPASFYNATTGIGPVDSVIRKVLKTGYCHHIERLMVLGNFMLLCEFDPDEVYRWFMELFIDAYDWVMVPNVYGMSQFADGGLFATKPYISGSNYLRKMSDYPAGPWQEIWDALFWRFVGKHKDFFGKNPRLSMMGRTFERMSDEKKSAHFSNANVFLEHLTS